MFYKKTLVLRPQGGNRPAVCALTARQGVAEVECRVADEVALMGKNGAQASALTNGVARLNVGVDGGFLLGLFTGGRLTHLYKEGDVSGNKNELLEWYKKNRVEGEQIKKAYDDEAIAQENYYALEGMKEGTFNQITCDIGGLFNLAENNDGQKSTSYPHCGKIGEECKNGKEGQATADKTTCDENEAQPQRGFAEGEALEGDNGVRQGDFYGRVEGQLNRIFESFPRERELERAVSGATFSRIVYSHDKWYVVGRTIYGGAPEYVIFGIPADRGIPKGLEDCSFFVPVGKQGYYLIYQNACDGSILRRK